ncbi:kynurenine formamidase [Saccharopolyspora lacisalsi]|uniref:Kynurenine formamidase n=1 Tax=Halosaccharopolyspora lacisalsi TaxID=1000566 RepID=A0A839DQ19_9PSEU|nr:cyclase family protein [Halosaccharopolyspora lacisalsi]MBA8824092.1 kynurenine formamidase [Halosaccharopolyspora lacisalsi]
MTRWKHRPEGATWGDFGPDDMLGRLNLVGPEQVRNGVAEVRDGLVFSLALPLDLPGRTVLNANRFPPVVRPTLRAGAVNFNCDMAVAHPGATDVMSDDLVVLHTQYSTQWDAFGHAGALFDADGDGTAEPVYYNGWRAGEDAVGPDAVVQAGIGSLGDLDGAANGTASTSHAGPVDISHMAGHGVQGRAVLVDLEAHFGPQRTIVGYEEFAGVLDSDGIVVEPGDFLVLHTGFTREVHARGGRPEPGSLDVCAVLDGADPELQGWIRDSEVVAIAADNYAVEAFPPTREVRGTPALPLHELCLFRLGVHLGELWWLPELAEYLRARDRSRFLLTAPPLRLPGATGSPLTPIATV